MPKEPEQPVCGCCGKSSLYKPMPLLPGERHALVPEIIKAVAEEKPDVQPE